jgi:sugar/nucleoside kinase (ribokinase family)
LAAFAWFMMQGGDVLASMTFANAAAAVTCKHRGTYAPTLEEIHR